MVSSSQKSINDLLILFRYFGKIYTGAHLKPGSQKMAQMPKVEISKKSTIFSLSSWNWKSSSHVFIISNKFRDDRAKLLDF